MRVAALARGRGGGTTTGGKETNGTLQRTGESKLAT